MLKILSIGNSFSMDAHRYLNGICSSAGYSIHNVNLYIGGCTLERHANYLVNNAKEYHLEIHGESTDKWVTIDEALRFEDWDVVTLQQASTGSFDFSTYEPFIHTLADHVRKVCPNAKIAIHQTWSYEDGSQMMANVGKKDHIDMFSGIKESYEKAFKAINADAFIPSGYLMELLMEKGIKVHRDTYHASFGLGRYALGLVWLKTLFGVDAKCGGFHSFDEAISDENKLLAEECATKAVKEMGITL